MHVQGTFCGVDQRQAPLQVFVVVVQQQKPRLRFADPRCERAGEFDEGSVRRWRQRKAGFGAFELCLNLRAGPETPENSFRVQLDDDGELVWVTEVDGVEVRFEHDPYSGFWERLVAGMIALLPVEHQL